MAKRKHTDESKPGPDAATSRLIADRLRAEFAVLCAAHPEVAPEAIAFEMYAAAYRLTGRKP